MMADKIEWGAGTPGPWNTAQASWNEDGDVQYTIRGVKEARAIDARAIAEVPAMVQILRGILAAMEVDERLHSIRNPRADAVRAILARIDGTAA